MAEHDPAEALARFTFLATIGGAIVCIGVAVAWVLW